MEINHYISGLKNGDKSVISEIYKQNLPQLTRWIVKNNGSEEDALDIFHEGIESIIRKIYDHKIPSNLNFGGYLFTICKNKWLDSLKETKKLAEVRNQELLRYTNEENEIEPNDDEEQKNLLRSMLKDTYMELSTVCQKLITLLESGLSPSEAAKEMDMTNANTVYRRKFACYDSWKKKIEAHKNYSLWNHS